MRRDLCIAATVFLFIGSAINGLAQHATTKSEKRRSIYLTIKGPEQSAARLRTVFEKAALEKDLLIAEDLHQADSRVNITISNERKIEKPLYAELLSATLVPREGQASTVSFCKQVTDGSGYSTVTTSYWAPTKESVPSHSAMWIEKGSSSGALAQLIRKKISDAGFQMAASASEADFTLKDIRLIKAPLQATAMEAKVQSVINLADGSMTTLSSNVKGYFSIAEPDRDEAGSCRSTIHHISDGPLNGYGEVASLDVALIAGRIKK